MVAAFVLLPAMQEKVRKPAGGRDKLLADLATRQQGVVSTRQLAQLGFSSSAIDRAVRRGRLRRVYRGVYFVGHERFDWQCRCAAAVLAVEPAVASHFSAAWLWGLLKSRPETIHLTTPSRRHQRRGFILHRAPLDLADKSELEGIPVTALGRTYLDLAALSGAERVGRYLERGEDLQIFDLGEVERALSRARGHPGRGPLRRALAIYRDDPAFIRSGVEERFRELMRASGLPMPAANFNIAGMELDAYWERERFAVELDVFATHGSRAAFERDRQREDDLQLLGIEVIRITDTRLEQEPQGVLQRVAAHLERRRKELGS
jgi:putative AbiEi antitoxin of type IV toxin-antitoxin system